MHLLARPSVGEIEPDPAVGLAWFEEIATCGRILDVGAFLLTCTNEVAVGAVLRRPQLLPSEDRVSVVSEAASDVHAYAEDPILT